MPKYKVNRSDGWPVFHRIGDFIGSGEPQYQVDEEFESSDPACEKGVEQGYLIRVEPAAKKEQKKSQLASSSHPAEDSHRSPVR